MHFRGIQFTPQHYAHFGNKYLLCSFLSPGLSNQIYPFPQCLVNNVSNAEAFSAGSFFSHQTDFLCLKHSRYGSTQIAAWVITEQQTRLQMTGAEQSAEASHVHSNSERAEKPDPGGKSRAVNENQMQCNSDHSAHPDLWAQRITSINRLIVCSTFIPQRTPNALQKHTLVTGSSVMWKANRDKCVSMTQAWNLLLSPCHSWGLACVACQVTLH